MGHAAVAFCSAPHLLNSADFVAAKILSSAILAHNSVSSLFCLTTFFKAVESMVRKYNRVNTPVPLSQILTYRRQWLEEKCPNFLTLGWGRDSEVHILHGSSEGPLPGLSPCTHTSNQPESTPLTDIPSCLSCSPRITIVAFSGHALVSEKLELR